MKEFVISSEDEGRRLDKYVLNILKNGQTSFVYRMLRKKNIVLNDKKAKGNEILRSGDCVKFYLSDETFEKFSAVRRGNVLKTDIKPDIVYEDSDMLIVFKPAGMLTQRASSDDISLNDICLSYVKNRGDFRPYEPGAFVPSVCNRLDRNTSGLVCFARTYRAARALTEGFRNRSVKKFYRCIVVGEIKEDLVLKGSVIKDEMTNTVTFEQGHCSEGKEAVTDVFPVRSFNGLTLADIRLHTGRTHQIRVSLSQHGNPILGDPKYGDRKINDIYKKKYGISCQLLSCIRLAFPDDFPLTAVAGRSFERDMPEEFEKVM